PGAFDAHGHFYSRAHQGASYAGSTLSLGPEPAGWAAYRDQVSQWMGDRTPAGGLFFAFPRKDADVAEANRFVAGEVRGNPNLRALMLVRPEDDPSQVEREVEAEGFAGFKVYLCYTRAGEPYQAEAGDFLPEWAWEIAARRNLAILLHLSKSRAVADPANLEYIRRHCLQYPAARLILAHCARSFCAANALEGLAVLSDLDNLYFDNSAICEPEPQREILRLFGPTRLMFGLDFPVSQLRGRAISVGEGFVWLDPENQDWSKSQFGAPTLIGIENLLALEQACRAAHATDGDIEQIFFRTAHQLFGLSSRQLDRGQQLYRRARKIIPGGTQLLSKRPELFAPEQWPPYFREARGCQVVDLDGRHYVDMSLMGIGSCLLGYADPDVTAAVVRRVEMGANCTLNPPEEVELAELLLELHPWAEKVRFMRTGGEAMAAAVRIARAATGRQAVAVCGYHGWHDWYLAANLAAPGRLDPHLLPGLEPAGVPGGLAGTVFTFLYDQPEELERILTAAPEPLAAVVMEPTRSQDPAPGFLVRVQELCRRHGARLIFDEITIGWKLALGGSHLKYGVTPDIAVFAKSISNGHPMAAVIGAGATMQAAQESFISSSYWTEGVGPAAALAAIRKMQRVDVVSHVDRLGQSVKQVWGDAAARHGLPLEVSGHNAICGFSLRHPQMLALETLFTARMLQAGFLATPRLQVSLAHQPSQVAAYARALDPVFAELALAIERNDVERRIGGPVRQTGFARLAP
ncbi:MAG: aminotransferase class III-fold pyridoxal phosphate-dependent enzyme, partial [Acidobacteria bacterium]|nr:aminotransferase class III-fold pyridoxal phosphate-dependent enzyme [Acidobacteriota bacterium]